MKAKVALTRAINRLVRPLILTYHGVDEDRDPLLVDPALFRAHLDCIAESGAEVLTISELVGRLAGDLPAHPVVALTFDDGFRSISRVAAPLLGERGFRATVFCVAGHVGGTSDWPSALPETPRRELASADELVALAALGWEVGAHGMTHAPLVADSAESAVRELIEAKQLLEKIVGSRVRSFAYPYGATPSPTARRIVTEAYDSACSTRIGYIEPDADLWALPRIDANYVRHPRVFRAALTGVLGPYLRTRGIGARARRAIRRDYAVEAS